MSQILGDRGDEPQNASEIGASDLQQQPDHDLAPALLDGLSLEQSPEHHPGPSMNRFVQLYVLPTSQAVRIVVPFD